MSDAEIKRFLVAHDALLSAKAADLEACAQVMVDYAKKSGDSSAWAFIFARFNDFIQQNEYPPMAFLRAFGEAFKTHRSGNEISLAEAFVGKRSRGAPSNGFEEHGWAETNAQLVAYFLKRPKASGARKRGELSPLDKAIDEVQTFRKSATGKLPPGNSAAQIKRQYYRFKK